MKRNAAKARLDRGKWSAHNYRRVTVYGDEIGEMIRSNRKVLGQRARYRFIPNELGQEIWGLPETLAHATAKLLLDQINAELVHVSDR